MTPRRARSTEERLRLALLATGLGTWDWDAGTGRLHLDARALEICGFTEETFGGTREAFSAVLVDEDRPALFAAIARGRAGGEYACRLRVRRANDGATRWTEARGSWVRDEHGEPAGAIGTLLDVTEQVAAEADLREREERLRLATESGGALLWHVDLTSGRVLFQTVATHLGYAPDEAPQTLEGAFDLVHEEDRAELGAALADALAGQTDRVATARHRRRDGTYRWLESRGRVLARDADGRPTRIAGTSVDVTERWEAAQETRRQKAIFDTILEHIPIMVHFHGRNGLVWGNAETERVYGWSRAELADKDLISLVYPDPADRAEAIAFVTASSGTWRTFRGRTKDNRIVEVAWCNVRLPDGTRVGIGRDTSVEAQLRQAQKLESLGLMAGGIAHDFNNLLVGILANTSLAREATKEPEIASLLTDVETSATRAAELTRQLLAYSGKGRVVLEDHDLGALANDMRALLASVVAEKASLHIEVAPGVPRVRVDGAQVRQILLSLVRNASEAVGQQGGTVTVRVGGATWDDARVRKANVAGLAPGRYAYLSVSDDGTGMTPEVASRIFDPFFTTKFAGRGLGLAAALGIARSHGGTLEVETALGGGSTLTLFLPAAAPEAARAAADEASVRAAKASSIVLVADDEPLVQNLARRVLERSGFRVVLASDGREALDAYDAHRDDVVAVLLDMTMPRLSGAEALAQLRARDAAVKVLLMSGFSQEDVSRRIDGPNVAFLQKPFLPRDLVAALADVLGRPEAR